MSGVGSRPCRDEPVPGPTAPLLVGLSSSEAMGTLDGAAGRALTIFRAEGAVTTGCGAMHVRHARILAASARGCARPDRGTVLIGLSSSEAAGSPPPRPITTVARIASAKVVLGAGT